MNWSLLLILIAGGLAIFLHGMTIMTDGLKAAAGSQMKQLLMAMTKNRWTSLLAGTGITVIIQSSSVTTVLAVGFVSAELLSFQSTLGLILGANLGTTITAQIIAFKITNAAWVMIAAGYLFTLISRKKTYKDIGTIILGLGFVFLGMNVMSEATGPLKTYPPFIQLMEGLNNYAWGILIGIIFTAVVQSSSATTGVIIVLASQGLLSTNAGIAIILGANIGTCITAVLSAIGKPRAAMRVACSHIFFNVAGVLLWFGFIDQLAELVEMISREDKARQIANAHTIFNVSNTILFIWFVHPISKLIMRFLPESKRKEEKKFPELLHSYYLENPSMALDMAESAIRKMGETVVAIIQNGIQTSIYGNSAQLLQLRESDREIDKGHIEILLFLKQVQSIHLSAKESERLEEQIEAVNILETAADLITTDLVEAAEHRISNKLAISENTAKMLINLYNITQDALRIAINKLPDDSNDDSRKDIKKAVFKNEYLNVRTHLMHRLSETGEQRISIFRFETEMLEIARRLHSLTRRLYRKVV